MSSVGSDGHASGSAGSLTGVKSVARASELATSIATPPAANTCARFVSNGHRPRVTSTMRPVAAEADNDEDADDEDDDDEED